MNDKYVIESHELNEGYAKEFTNVMLNGKRLVKNPEAKIINYFVIYPVYILLCIGYSVLCGIFLKKWDSMSFTTVPFFYFLLLTQNYALRAFLRISMTTPMMTTKPSTICCQ